MKNIFCHTLYLLYIGIGIIGIIIGRYEKFHIGILSVSADKEKGIIGPVSVSADMKKSLSVYRWVTSIQSIMDKKITNVTLVERHFLKQENWRNTLIQFMMVKKITNVTHVERNFLKKENWSYILIQFIMVKKITNVTMWKGIFNSRKLEDAY